MFDESFNFWSEMVSYQLIDEYGIGNQLALLVVISSHSKFASIYLEYLHPGLDGSGRDDLQHR